MAVPNPAHFFDQADKLMAPPPGGPPREVDLRRAISAAYYGLFHAVAAAAADHYVGRTRHSTGLYALVYRSVEHKRLKTLCNAAKNSRLDAKYAPYVQAQNFGQDIQDFAKEVVQHQEKRHKHDYDPLTTATLSDARLAVESARAALARFNRANSGLREIFLGLLLFNLRDDK